MISAKGVGKRFGRKWALRNVDLELNEGIYGFLGPNGAGKTTFLRCMMGVYTPTEGTFYWDDKPVSSRNDPTCHMGYLPQRFGAYGELKLCEVLEHLAGLRGMSMRGLNGEIDRCLALVHLQDRVESKVRTLSGGMVRRLGIAAALLGDPEILIFDEPTAGLDPEERLRFKTILELSAPGKAILLSTHILSDVNAVADRIVIINKGSVICNLPSKDLTELARGKTFEVTGEPDPQEVVESWREGDVLHSIIVSSNPPAEAIPTEPRMEDGYAAAIQGL